MTQVILKKGIEVDAEDLYIILRETSQWDEKRIEDMWKQYHLFKNYNPRYQEEIPTIKDAKLKIDSSDIIASSKYNLY